MDTRDLGFGSHDSDSDGFWVLRKAGDPANDKRGGKRTRHLLNAVLEKNSFPIVQLAHIRQDPLIAVHTSDRQVANRCGVLN